MLVYMGACYRNGFVLTSISLLLITGKKNLNSQWLKETIVWVGNLALLHNMESWRRW